MRQASFSVQIEAELFSVQFPGVFKVNLGFSVKCPGDCFSVQIGGEQVFQLKLRQRLMRNGYILEVCTDRKLKFL